MSLIGKAKKLSFILEWGDLLRNEPNLRSKDLIRIVANSKIEVEDQIGNLENRANITLDIFATAKNTKLNNLLTILEKAQDLDTKISAPILKILSNSSKESIQNLLLKQKQKAPDKDFVDLIYALSSLSKQKPDEKISKTILEAIDKQFLRENFSRSKQNIFKKLFSETNNLNRQKNYRVINYLFSSPTANQNHLLDYAFEKFDKNEYEEFNKLVMILKDSEDIANYAAELEKPGGESNIEFLSSLNFDKSIDPANIFEKIKEYPKSKATLKNIFEKSFNRNFDEIAKEYIVEIYDKKDEILSLTSDKQQSKINYYLNTLLPNLKLKNLQTLMKQEDIQKSILNTDKKLTKKEEKKKSLIERQEFFNQFINTKNLQDFDSKDLDQLKLAINLADRDLQIKLIDDILKNDSLLSALAKKKEDEILTSLIKNNPEFHAEITRLEPGLSSIKEKDKRMVFNALELHTKKNMRDSVRSFLKNFAVKLYGDELSEDEIKEFNTNMKKFSLMIKILFLKKS